MRAKSGQPAVIEVQRPEGVCLTALVARAEDLFDMALQPEASPGWLWRAPRFVRLVIQTTNGGPSSALYDELLRRPFKLGLFMSQRRVPVVMQWPDQKATFVPVFADTQSVDRAAHELAIDPTSQVAGMYGRELLTWALEGGLGVALGAFAEEGVRYVRIEPSTIVELLRRFEQRH